MTCLQVQIAQQQHSSSSVCVCVCNQTLSSLSLTLSSCKPAGDRNHINSAEKKTNTHTHTHTKFSLFCRLLCHRFADVKPSYVLSSVCGGAGLAEKNILCFSHPQLNNPTPLHPHHIPFIYREVLCMSYLHSQRRERARERGKHTIIIEGSRFSVNKVKYQKYYIKRLPIAKCVPLAGVRRFLIPGD